MLCTSSFGRYVLRCRHSYTTPSSRLKLFGHGRRYSTMEQTPETSSDDLAAPRYQYKPLPSRSSVRLLHLAPTPLTAEWPSSHLLGVLKTYPLPSPQPYQALSYVWGSGIKSHTIVVFDGDVAEKSEDTSASDVYTLPITESLYQALDQLQSHGRHVPIWVDALSINQEDVQEKNEQVKQMGSIYEAADSVIAFLGCAPKDHEAGIRLAIRLNEMADHNGSVKNRLWDVATRAHQVGDCGCVVEPVLQDGRNNTLERLRASSLHKWPSKKVDDLLLQPGGQWTSVLENPPEDSGLFPVPSLDDPGWEPLREMLNSPWLQRTWIIQEAVLANELFLAINGDIVDSEFLLATQSNRQNHGMLPRHVRLRLDPIMNEKEKRQDGYNYDLRPPSGPHLLRFLDWAKTRRRTITAEITQAVGSLVYTMRSTRMTRHHEKPRMKELPFSRIMAAARVTRCKEPKDKVYGLVGILAKEDEDIKDALTNIVNYDKDLHEIYTSAMMILLTNPNYHGGARILEQACTLKNSPDLPSWVADWSVNAHIAAQHIQGNHRYHAAGDTSSDIDFMPGNRLKIKGVRIDTISHTESISGITQILRTLAHMSPAILFGPEAAVQKRYGHGTEEAIAKVLIRNAMGPNSYLGFRLCVERLRCLEALKSLDLEREPTILVPGVPNSWRLMETRGPPAGLDAVVCTPTSASQQQRTDSEHMDMVARLPWVRSNTKREPGDAMQQLSMEEYNSEMAQREVEEIGGLESFAWQQEMEKSILQYEYAHHLSEQAEDLMLSTLFVTGSGFVGKANKLCQRGDVVAVFDGGSVAMILGERRTSDGSVEYVLKSTAYVEGLMVGEAYDKRRLGGDYTKEYFVIR